MVLLSIRGDRDRRRRYPNAGTIVIYINAIQHRRFKPDMSAGERQDQHRNILMVPHNGTKVTLLSR